MAACEPDTRQPDPFCAGGAFILSQFAKDQPLYLRASAIACKSRTDLCVVSVGNLVRNEAKVGITCCAFSQLIKATEQGFMCNSYDISRKVLTIHNPVHAYESCGATWVLSVPVWGPWHDDFNQSSPDDVIGFLTLAWALEPVDKPQYIRTAQRVAEEVAGGLLRAMQPELDIALEFFLPNLQPPLADEKQHIDPCRPCAGDVTHPGESPGGSGVPAACSSSSDGSWHSRPPLDEEEGRRGSAGLPCWEEIKPETGLGEAALPETPRKPIKLLKPRIALQTLLLQRLKPASLFGYLTHRELICCSVSIAVAFVSVGMCTSQAVAGGRIAATLLLCFVVEALLHTCFSLCQKASHVVYDGAGALQLPFRTTSMLRARIIMPLCCYTLYFAVRKCLGLSSIAACAVTALPLLAGNCGLLFFMTQSEASNRGRPFAGRDSARVSI